MAARSFGDWKVWTSVDQADQGPLAPVIHVQNKARGISRSHQFTGFHHAQAIGATDFAERQLDDVTGVSDDGTLQFG